MKKNIKLSLITILILIIVCTIVVIWNPCQANKAEDSSSSSLASSQLTESSSSLVNVNSSIVIESSILLESSVADVESSNTAESSFADISGLVPEDQPDDPDLNFEASGSSYDDIMVNVLTCLLTKDTQALSGYVGSQGLRLSPTGIATGADVILSADELSNFFSMGTQSYGTYPGSGEDIYLTSNEYYDRYLVPAGFDFSAASVSYNDAGDLDALSGYVQDPKTVSYKYTPNVMEWKRIILVYGSEGSGDVLCGVIYQDVTTN